MTNKTIVQWNAAAQKYAEDQELSEYAERNKQTVREMFQCFSGEKVLDLGCGYGWYTDYFRGIGADVVGVDGSDKMLEIARSFYPECSFLLCDIEASLPFDDGHFDLIFCNQVLMDIENIESVFSECRRVLKPQGILYYSIVHPAFYDCHWIQDENGFKYAKSMRSYISTYSVKNDFWGITEHYHRPLSQYLNLAAKYGFCLQHIEEPISYDGITKNSDLPLFFFAEYIKL